MSAPTEKLVKLLNSFSASNADAEVLKAARTVHEIVARNGWNWGQLLANSSADTSVPALTEEQFQRIFGAGVEQGETRGYERGFADAQVSMPGPKTPRTEIGDQLVWLERLLAAAAQAEAAGQLTDKETTFTQDMRRATRQFGRAAQFTQRQLDWLRGIEQGLRRRGYL